MILIGYVDSRGWRTGIGGQGTYELRVSMYIDISIPDRDHLAWYLPGDWSNGEILRPDGMKGKSHEFMGCLYIDVYLCGFSLDVPRYFISALESSTAE